MDTLKNQITSLAQRDLKAQTQMSSEKKALEEAVKQKQAELAAQEAAKQEALAAAAKAVTTSAPSGPNLLGSLVSAVASTTPAGGLLGALATGLTSNLNQAKTGTTGVTAAEAEVAVAEAKRLAEQKALELKQAQEAARALDSKYAPKLDEVEISNLTAKYTKLQNDADTIRIYQSSRNCTGL